MENNSLSFEKRVAIYFAYEGYNNNPNGDPANENKPRQYTGKEVLTTDVSSKRDDRDYLIGLNSNVVFLRQQEKEDGHTMKMDDLLRKHLSILVNSLKGKNDKKNNIANSVKVKYLLNRFIDLKFFGAAFTGDSKKEDSLKESVTGMIQKSFGVSLNYPNVLPVKITTVLATKDDTKAGTGSMGTKYVLDYYYIHQDIIINPKSLKTWGVSFTEDDFKIFEKTQWSSIKDDITHSKLDREPLIMIEIFFKDDDFYFLPMKYVKSKNKEKVKNFEGLEIDFSELVEKIDNEKTNIEKIRYKVNGKVKNLFETDFLIKLNEITKEEIEFIQKEKITTILSQYENYKIF
ncbi:MAG: type I CRISPR-associated protein Cas7 [Elusimicrobiota bacterium]|jgi:CRISPR-associated protein Csh2|nr:type I CRISPR-associated protein Cas7 [Elusimicrobiota bacterium]